MSNNRLVCTSSLVHLGTHTHTLLTHRCTHSSSFSITHYQSMTCFLQINVFIFYSIWIENKRSSWYFASTYSTDVVRKKSTTSTWACISLLPIFSVFSCWFSFFSVAHSASTWYSSTFTTRSRFSSHLSSISSHMLPIPSQSSLTLPSLLS
jgi:hypothetical protein